jgi:hypothetical protein
MTKINLLTGTVFTAISLSGAALAGDVAAETAAPASSNNGDWCAGFKTIGKFYKNEDDPYIQELKFSGRLQAQYGYIDGEDIDGNNFDEGIDEIRRLRFGAEVKFLNGFKIKGEMNLVDDRAKNGEGRDYKFKDWDQLKLSYSQKDVAGFDKAGLTYGRHKVGIGHEAYTSSKKIKTVERSALSNKIYNGRWTGFTLNLERGNWQGTIGYFGQDKSEESHAWGSINQGSSYYLRSAWDLNHGDLAFDFFHNADNKDDLVKYDWVASLSYETEIANWNLVVNTIYGDNGGSEYQSQASREGNFYGLVIMPSTYIIEDRLEFVARYTYQASEEDEGIRANSRYFRTPEEISEADVNGGRGDSHHSIYTGLNYFLCGHNSKVMVGAEYETLDTANGDADATTLWAAYRMYF